MTHDFSRRGFMAASAAGLSACVLARMTSAQHPSPSILRVAHITDLHQMPRRNALRGIEVGIEAMLRHKPDLILQTGDIMTGTMSRPLDEARQYMGEIEAILRRDLGVPMVHAIGNHDIWGWTRSRSDASGDESIYGKRWWIDTFGGGRRYSLFRFGAWHILSLDSVQPFEESYRGGLDDEQFEWLVGELTSLGRDANVLVLSHIPILCAGAVLTDAAPGTSGDRGDGVRMPHASTYTDPWRVINAFQMAGNVKLVLSGHVHVEDRIDYLGTTHICGGALAGAWWQPPEVVAANANERAPAGVIRPQRSKPGFGIVELHANGEFVHRYEHFDWTYSE